MSKHQVNGDQDWFHCYYRGEDRDDGCANELSLSTDPAADQLDLLVSNPGFNNESHDDTFALQKGDVKKLSAFLQSWLKRHS
ncbi:MULTISPECIES: hypothetical protein [Limosilactobacillus]|jgi:type I restriction-modification system DNA methylase subunit|uniref:hypothetical protein n=1 Tax=Limosilactobacillus TaxID=2742598 RepID=UPI00064ABBB4|nr:hypothetical protein [Limosilactobacillus panis]